MGECEKKEKRDLSFFLQCDLYFGGTDKALYQIISYSALHCSIIKNCTM